MLPNDPNMNAGILRITLKQWFDGLRFWREPLINWNRMKSDYWIKCNKIVLRVIAVLSIATTENQEVEGLYALILVSRTLIITYSSLTVGERRKIPSVAGSWDGDSASLVSSPANMYIGAYLKLRWPHHVERSFRHVSVTILHAILSQTFERLKKPHAKKVTWNKLHIHYSTPIEKILSLAQMTTNYR